MRNYFKSFDFWVDRTAPWLIIGFVVVVFAPVLGCTAYQIVKDSNRYLQEERHLTVLGPDRQVVLSVKGNCAMRERSANHADVVCNVSGEKKRYSFALGAGYMVVVGDPE